jgi:hypothetical protein
MATYKIADCTRYIPYPIWTDVCLSVLSVVQINARRINDELNVFKDLHKSAIFIGVLLVTAGLQVGCNGALRVHSCLFLFVQYTRTVAV